MHKILLVEDYPVIQEMYGKVLTAEGFDIDTVGDGQDALKAVAEKHYDLILLDLLLPQTNGIEFLKQFKNRGDTKIVILSDFDQEASVKQAFALGITDYLLKVDNVPHVLAQKLHQLLGDKPAPTNVK